MKSKVRLITEKKKSLLNALTKKYLKRHESNVKKSSLMLEEKKNK